MAKKPLNQQKHPLDSLGWFGLSDSSPQFDYRASFKKNRIEIGAIYEKLWPGQKTKPSISKVHPTLLGDPKKIYWRGHMIFWRFKIGGRFSPYLSTDLTKIGNKLTLASCTHVPCALFMPNLVIFGRLNSDIWAKRRWKSI